MWHMEVFNVTYEVFNVTIEKNKIRENKKKGLREALPIKLKVSLKHRYTDDLFLEIYGGF